MATMNGPLGDPGRAGLAGAPREPADADAAAVDRDLNRIFAATIRRPPPPLSKKKLQEAKKEFRGTPQRAHGLTVVMGLAVAVGLFGLCVWTLLDKVQDATSGEAPAGTSVPTIAAVAYNKPPAPVAAAPSPAATQTDAAAAPPASPPVQVEQAAPAPAVVAPPPAPVAPPAPPTYAKAVVRPAPAPAPLPAYAKAAVNVAPLPPAVQRPQVPVAARPAAPPVLANAAPPPAPRLSPPPVRAPAQLAYNNLSPPRPIARSSSRNADAMLKALAAEPLKPAPSSTPASYSGAPAATDAKPCESAEGCGSYGLVQAADSRLSRAFAAAVEAGVSQQLLGDVKGRWASLRSDTSRRPGDLLADYASMTRSLWKARDQAVGVQRASGAADDQARSLSK